MPAYCDRSRLIQDHRCPRSRYLEYEFPTGAAVPGITSIRLSKDLMVGLLFHEGVQQLLLGDELELAVSSALGTFWTLVKSQGLQLQDTEDAYYVYNEHAALGEALIRAYYYAVLPKLLERFTVVEVEREDVSTFTLDDFELHWGSRADGLLLEKGTNDLYVLSLKTTKTFTKRNEDSANHDMQGLSEVAAIDQRLAKWQTELDTPPESYAQAFHWDIPAWFIKRHKTGAPPSVFGVTMQHALKGLNLESPQGSGRWYYNSPLIRPYKFTQSGNPKSRTVRPDYLYAAYYDYKDDLGGAHRLGPQWQRLNIWEEMGVKEWIEILNSTMIQGYMPGHVLENSFVLPNEYYRNEDDMARWEKRTLFHERRTAEGREKALQAFGTPLFEEVLDEYFEPHSTSCDYPGRCKFQEICYGPKEFLLNPLATRLYQIRVPNHKVEEDLA